MPNPELIEQAHERAGLRLLRRAIHGRWDIPEVLLEQLPKHVTAMMVNARTDREKLRAAEVIVAMNRDNMNALIHADRVERLDAGLVTERVAVLDSMTDEQMLAVASAIRGNTAAAQPTERKPRKPCRKPRKKR